MKRTIVYVSDGTGITAENIGRSLLTQFENLETEHVTLSYVNSLKRAKEAVSTLEAIYRKDQVKPIVFSTLVNPEIRELLESSSAVVLDIFKAFINPLEQELKIQSNHSIGKTHGLNNVNKYMLRMNAVNFALTNDDGANVHDYQNADVILIGVSRCGKTPTCLYLAMQFGIYAANYPITADDLASSELPQDLRPLKNKLFGLTIEPVRLQQIRYERRPNTAYSSLQQCQQEIKHVMALFKKEYINYINTTKRSIEEIATEIISRANLKRRVY